MNVPKLRFPTFTEEWERKRLDEVAPLQRGFDLPIDKIIEGEYPVIFSNGILKYHREFKAKAPGVVTGRSGTIGKVTYIQKDYWPHNTSLWVTDFKDNHPKFIFYFYLKFKLERFGTGSGVPTLNRNDIHLQKEYFPNLSEQEKIASFLTAVDEKLNLLKKKKTLLEQYKKGVMEKLLLKQLRFKNEDGSNYPKWESKKLGEVAEIKRGAASQHLIYINTEKEGVRFLRINDFLSNEPVYVKNTVDMQKFTVNTNDLLMAGTGATAGIVFIVPEKFNKLSYSYNAPRIRVNTAYFLFIYYYLNSDTILRQQKGLFVGNAQHFLDTDAMRSLKIALPCLQEQTKIANFLSAMDEKINHYQKQIEKTELWKKGLLQKMFV